MIDFGNRYVQAGMIFFGMFVAIPTFWDVVFSGPPNAEAKLATPNQVREVGVLVVPMRLYAQNNPDLARQAFVSSYRTCAEQHTTVDLPDYFYDVFGGQSADVLLFESEFDSDLFIDQTSEMIKKLTREPDHILSAAQAFLQKLQPENMTADIAVCSLRLASRDLNI